MALWARSRRVPPVLPPAPPPTHDAGVSLAIPQGAHRVPGSAIVILAATGSFGNA